MRQHRLTHVSQLGGLFLKSPWVASSTPFPHITARQVFNAGSYKQLAVSHSRLLQKGFSDTDKPGSLSRRIAGYDAYSLNLVDLDPNDPLCVFISRAWHDLLALITGVDATGDVNAAIHAHTPHSSSGTVHNDLNPGFFVDDPTEDGLNVANWRICDYCSG